MEKAIITKSGKGWLLKFETGKTMPINWSNIPKEWDNSDIEVVRIAGQPESLKNGTVILKKPSTPPIARNDNQGYNDRGFHQNNQNQPRNNPPRDNNDMANIDSAKSPYNFVPLNDEVVYPNEQRVFFDKYNSERNTGHINLEIANKTPLFIRGKNEFFLLINGKPIIPGSTLRGLIRNMVGVLSYSKIEFINDSRFFYRSFADAALRLRAEYNRKITISTNVGILFQNNKRDYSLVPTRLIGTIPDVNIVNDCIFNPTTRRWKLYSGSMPSGRTRKENNYEIEGRLTTDPGAIEIKWDDNLIKEYENDINRKGFDVLKELKSKPICKTNGIPVFYQVDSSGKLISFGNTKNYRLPYQLTVKNHLYPCHSQHEVFTNERGDTTEKIDFVNLIFGKTSENNKDEQAIATRVYFEDAICDNPRFDSTMVLKILASPKPTSFQLYLEQQPDGVNTSPSALKHWNDTDAAIRGFKNYWHKNDITGVVYRERVGTQKPSSSNPDPIRPISSNNTFIGRIRFENLTNIELGALLYALELPDGCCHKIGMGKPLGLGTIQIKPTIVLENRRKRYDQIIDSKGNWEFALDSKSQDYKKIFSEFIFSQIRDKKQSLWETERLSQLKAMLEYDETLNASPNWFKETRYMEIKRRLDKDGNPHLDGRGNPKPKNEFADRVVLDTPKEINKKRRET